MYEVSKGVRSTHGQDGAVVLDIDQGQMFSVNLVGSKILELLELGKTEPEIVNAICQEFKADRDIVQNDVGEFIHSLKLHKLLSEPSKRT
ncbi:MAG TPA: PqqD family protein [Terriglobales bacterium]|nr:PqqD family protein [Terriglobales bacterium]